MKHCCFLLFVTSTLAVSSPIAAQSVDFNRDVRPILSRHCFKCHGPDDKQRQAGLRLDVRDGAVAKLESGEPAIIAGKPEASELVRRISAADEVEVMPPPATKNPLTAVQKEVLKQLNT